MKKIYVILCFLVAASSFAETLTGFDVMKKVDERAEPTTSTATIEMNLINAKGKVRVRTISVQSKKYATDTKKVMTFLKPADVKGVGYLSISYKEKKDDERWLYMPALKKVRRISGSGSGDSFMGSDFSYDDMSGYKLDEYEYTLLGTEALDGKQCWKVSSVPHKKKDYAQFILWVDQESLMQVKAEFYDNQEKLIKVLTMSDLEQQDGFWLARKMNMENVQTKHRTVIKVLKAEYNKPLSDSLFRVSSLESGGR